MVNDELKIDVMVEDEGTRAPPATHARRRSRVFTLVEPAREPARVPWEPSLWVIGALVCAATWAVLALSGCAGTTVQSGPVPGGPIPVGCYAAALQWADEAALKQCGGVWSMCEHRSSILTELDRKLEACDAVSDER